jgi:hypothetical protein
MLRRIGALVATGAAALALTATAEAQQSGCTGQLDADPKPGPLIRFGITPGVQTGQLGTGPVPPRTPEEPAKQLAALAQLRPANGPFVLRLHRFFWSEGEAGIEHFLKLAKRYTSHGYLVELQLRYHPSPEQEGDIPAWLRHVREVVDRFGPNPRVVAIQVTNEVNLAISPDSSDGSFDGAREALIQGVKAAKAETRKRGFSQLEIGFNWAYRNDPSNEQSFWEYLRDHGGPSFERALDWVGVDAYPGTFIPPANTPGGERSALVNVFTTFRCYAAIPKIPESVPIHVEENGWPTGPGRSYERQAEAMDTMVHMVHDFRGTFNISDYRWFNLRDGDSTSPNFQTQYGLMTDEYVPKPAFGLYRRLVKQFTVSAPLPPAPGGRHIRLHLRVRCRAGAWRARVGGPDVKRVARVTFRVGNRHARPDTKRPFRRSISARNLHPGRSSWTMVARVRLKSGGRLRFERTVHRCS